MERLVAGPWPRDRRGVIRPALRAARRFLRLPTVIVGELVAIALAGILGATLPQAGTASLAELVRFRASGPVAAVLVDVFALDRVFRSAWFVALTLLASASLSIVIVDQVRRLRVLWGQCLTEGQFERAPFRVEFERPVRVSLPEALGERRVEIRMERRIGLAGSPAFHAGLLLVIVAGALRALFAADAVVDLIEGETLAPTAAAWAAQWPGVLARPFRLEAPVRLEAVTATRYETGEMRDLTVRVSVQGEGSLQEAEIGVNRELRVPGGRLFLGPDFGPAALLEWRASGGPPAREAVHLASRGKGLYEGATFGPGEVRAYLRAEVDRAGTRPARLEVRIVPAAGSGRSGLLFAGSVGINEEVSLPSAQTLTLHGVPFWARLRGSRDPGLPLAYLGFALVLVGATIIFTVVKVDTCVAVTPAGDRERVMVALRAQRFAPLFQERFARLVREQGGAA